MPKRKDGRLENPYSTKVFPGNVFSAFLGLDKRTHLGRLVRDLTALLVEHLGGEPTISQKLLIERVVRLKLQLDSFDLRIERGETWTDLDRRTYSGLVNSYSRQLRELESLRKPGQMRAKVPSLQDIFDAQQADI